MTHKYLYLLLIAICISTLSLHAQDADGVYTKVDENPAPVKTSKPVYPMQLKRDGTTGLVALTCVIDEKGEVLSVKVSRSSHPGFDNAAMEALQKWKFKPAKKDGKAVKVKVTIPFRFNLDE